MKRITIVALGIFTIAVTSCTKDEFRAEQAYAEPVVETAAASAAPVAAVSGWEPVTEWNVAQENNALQSGRIGNAGIASEIADNGLVLVFAKKGDVLQSLPYTNGDVYWSYQVEQGNVVINASSAPGTRIDRQQAFQHIVLSKEQLDALETKGVSKVDLMNLSYNKVIEIVAGK